MGVNPFCNIKKLKRKVIGTEAIFYQIVQFFVERTL
jgi:hypothetical protein